MKFETWMKKVDQQIAAVCGLGSGDLGDRCYADMHADGVTPAEAARDALEAEGFPFDD